MFQEIAPGGCSAGIIVFLSGQILCGVLPVPERVGAGRKCVKRMPDGKGIDAVFLI